MKLLLARTPRHAKEAAADLEWTLVNEARNEYRTKDKELAYIISSRGDLMGRPPGTVLLLGFDWSVHPEGKKIFDLAQIYKLGIEYLPG